MPFSPKFLEIFNKCNEMMDRGPVTRDVQEYFFTAVKGLSQEERLNNLYRIRPRRPVPGEASRLQFFSFNKMQRDFHASQSNRDLILKMRQGGVTTYSCIKALDNSLWGDGTHNAIMAHVRDNVKKFFQITKTAFKCFQRDWGSLYPVSQAVDNVSELRINETGSQLIVCTETKGLTLDFLHISEACFVTDERISESLESVPLSGQVILESTPNTASGMFYDMWDMISQHKACSFKAHFYPWWFHYPEAEDLPVLHPNKDFVLSDKEKLLKDTHELSNEHIIWRRLKISEAGGDEGEFSRKYPEDAITCFLSGTGGVFPAYLIQNMKKNEKDPAFKGDLVAE